MSRLKDAPRRRSPSTRLPVLQLFPLRPTAKTLRWDVLVGISTFFGLNVAIPLSNYAAKIVAGAQDNLTKARDERVALMNEETFIDMLQSTISLRWIEKHLNTPELTLVPPLANQSQTIAFQSCAVT
ncbi:hypothetical protein DFH07DRAFT_956108 [Mycena maculata]|uniref:Uncharacterized protein n=1 Tax=Mycena maculata TaxID=230809 RepID=A0AAD7JJW5_9AGAR|nr:hypothetical protein DFH07DRAFT_956108 [Mycena maculata]